MGDQFSDELDPFEVTVAVSLVGVRRGTTIFRAVLENGTGAEGGDVELEITDSARSTFGVGTCVSEFERWINSALGPDFRLGAALAMAEFGAFRVVRGNDARLHVVDPETRMRLDLAA